MNKELEKIIDEAINGKDVAFVFDFDGVIIEARYNQEDKSYISRFDWFEENFGVDISKARLIEPVYILITKLLKYNIKVFSLSYCHTEEEAGYKKDLMHKVFNGFKAENMIASDSNKGKVQYIESLMKTHELVVFIEDTLDNLIMVERKRYNKELLDNVQCFHISSLMNTISIKDIQN